MLDKNPNPTARGGPQGARRQHLPVRHLHRRPPGGPGRGQSHERSLTHGQPGPRNPRLIGTRIPRLDGLAKASGQAKYPSDVRPEGTLFGVMLYSPHAHAKVKSIDTSAGREDARRQGGRSLIAKAGTTLRYQGDDIAAVAAETEEQARDAVRAIKVEYEVLPHVVTEAQAMADGRPEVFKGGQRPQGPRARPRASPTRRWPRPTSTIEATYSRAGHHPRLPRAPRPDRQVGRRRQDRSPGRAPRPSQASPASWPSAFKIPPANVTVLTEVMGGGFGSKFGADIWGRTAAELVEEGRRPAGQDVPRPRPGAPGRGQPAQRQRPRQARRDQGRQARRA